jgi:hypothetical protein
MNEIEKNNITNLLYNVSLISKKYEDLAEYTGENFNVFNILGIYSSELSHSSFIANLLNVKGKHGQKDIFLELFIEEFKEMFKENSMQRNIIKNFNLISSKSVVEHYAGKVNYENGEGGFIDILIKDGENKIIIENKIWAVDQPKQLLRYNQFDKNAPIIYLTLNGKLPSDNSKGELELGKEFICLSYETNIVNWIEKCIKEMANKPIIRETLNQYLVLVKQITHQSYNKKMENEIIDLILLNKQNILSSKLIFENYNKSINKLKNDQIKIFIEHLKKYYFKDENISIERSKRDDEVFITFKTFELSDGLFDLGINLEFDNNWFFFCVVRKNNVRESNVNTNVKFKSIKEFLHSRIVNLNQVNGWTIGKSNDFIIGVDNADYYLPTTDNTEIFDSLAKKLFDLNKLLEK